MARSSEGLLVSSASAKIPLITSVINEYSRVFESGRVVAGDTDPRSLTSYAAPEFIQLPRTEDAQVQSWLSILSDQNIKVVLPTRDGELGFWARWKNVFEQNSIKVLIAPKSAVELSLDKLAFAAQLRSRGLPAIETSRVLSSASDGRYVVKERFGAGSKGLALNLASLEATEAAGAFEEPIFQPFIEGTEYSVDLWISKNGEDKVVSPRVRNLVRNGESQVTTLVDDRAIEDLAVQTVAAIGLTGLAVVQVIKDAQGGLHVVECNCRIGGASTASIAGGVPLVELAIRDVLDEDYKGAISDIERKLITQVRVPQDKIFE